MYAPYLWMNMHSTSTPIREQRVNTKYAFVCYVMMRFSNSCIGSNSGQHSTKAITVYACMHVCTNTLDGACMPVKCKHKPQRAVGHQEPQSSQDHTGELLYNHQEKDDNVMHKYSVAFEGFWHLVTLTTVMIFGHVVTLC